MIAHLGLLCMPHTNTVCMVLVRSGYSAGMEWVWSRYSAGMEWVWCEYGAGTQWVWSRYGVGMKWVWCQYSYHNYNSILNYEIL